MPEPETTTISSEGLRALLSVAQDVCETFMGDGQDGLLEGLDSAIEAVKWELSTRPS